MKISLIAALLLLPTTALAQEVGATVAPTSVPTPADQTVGEPLRITSVETFEDREPSRRGQVIVIRYFMGDVAIPEGQPDVSLVGPTGEAYSAVPKSDFSPDQAPTADAVGQALGPQTAVFQLPLFEMEDPTGWRLQVGSFGTGVQIVLQ